MSGSWWSLLALACGAAPVADQAAPSELVVHPGEQVAATIDGRPARLTVGSARIDRLTLDTDYVASAGIKPALIMGKAELAVAGRREFKGQNATVTLAVARRLQKGRAYWFEDAPKHGADGSVGPWGLPQERVTFVLGPEDPAATLTRAPMGGDADSTSFTGFKVGDGMVGIGFDVEDGEQYPVESAAAAALIAKTFGGVLSGPSWDIEVLMGVKRPVRLLTLAKPMPMGPLSFTKIAVRVRDRIDASGRGREIAEAVAPPDPSEVVVEGVAKKGVRPIYTLSIPRAGLKPCWRISYDKAAHVIELMCRAGGA